MREELKKQQTNMFWCRLSRVKRSHYAADWLVGFVSSTKFVMHTTYSAYNECIESWHIHEM